MAINVSRFYCSHSRRFPPFFSVTPLRSATWVFFGLSLHSYQFAVSTPFGVHPSVHPRSPPPGEYACVPSFPSRQQSAGKSQAPPPQTLPAAPASASDFRSPLLATRGMQISCLLHEKPAIPREGTLP